MATVSSWTKQFGTSLYDENNGGIAVDSLGNIFVTGETYGAFDGYSNSGKQDIFLVKFDSNGDLQ